MTPVHPPRDRGGRAAAAARAGADPLLVHADKSLPAGNLPVPLTDANVRAGWSDLLSRYEWDAFATLTYSGAVWAAEKVVRNFREWLYRWQVETAIARGLCTERKRPRVDRSGQVVGVRVDLSGPWRNNYRKGRADPVWVLGVEPHKSGRLHAHALVRWSPLLPDLERRRGWHLWSAAREAGGLGHGFARIEPPRGQDSVAEYVTKYVVKGGELYLSPSFDAAKLVAA